MIGLRAGLSLGLIHYAGPGGPQAWVPIIRGRRGWPLPWQHSVQMKDRCPPPAPRRSPWAAKQHQGSEAAESLNVKTEA